MMMICDFRVTKTSAVFLSRWLYGLEPDSMNCSRIATTENLLDRQARLALLQICNMSDYGYTPEDPAIKLPERSRSLGRLSSLHHLLSHHSSTKLRFDTAKFPHASSAGPRGEGGREDINPRSRSSSTLKRSLGLGCRSEKGIGYSNLCDLYFDGLGAK